MKNKTKIATLSTVLSTISLASTLYRDARSKYDERTLYTARISDSAYVYRLMMTWINDEIQGRRVKFISNYNGVQRFYDGTGKTRVNVGGHWMTVQVEKPDVENIKGFSSDDELMSDNLVFTSKTKAGIDALEKFLVELTEKRNVESREIYLYNTNGYSGWDGKDFHFRDLDSVFLPEGVKEHLLDDIDTFLESKERYRVAGIPWHRGYLFYGPPGNGKSSLAATLAHKLKFNLYNLPLSGVKDDKHLAELISRIQDKSILLLEDIDIFSASVKRDNGDKGPTLAGLLNALDGVNTPDGLLTLITTNYKDNLDSALIRPGRIDFQLELSAPVQFQVDTMFEHVYGEPLNVEAREFDSMAALANVFKMSITDPEAARLAIKKD